MHLPARSNANLEVEPEQRRADAEQHHPRFALENKIEQLEAELRRLNEEIERLRNGRTSQQVKMRTTVNSASLISEHQLLNKVVSVVPNVIYVFNQDKMANEYSNKEIAATLGYSQEEIQELGDALIPTLCHPEDLPSVISHLAKIKNLSGREVAQLEYRMRHKDGRYRWLLSYDTVFERDTEGRVVKHIGSASDITEMKEAQTKLQLANEELENFTYIASHDLKTPLVNMESILLLLKGSPEIAGNDSMGLLDMLGKAIGRGKKILENLMSVVQARYTAGEGNASCDLGQIASETIDGLNPSIGLSEQTFTVDFSEVSELIYNPAHLESIFSNLLSNAVKYRDPTRDLRVHLESKRVDEQICILFQDNGLGIDLSKDLNKVFGLCKRAHDHCEGNGVGLYLTQKILKANGGRIEVESEPGRGATFKVFLAPGS